MGVLTYLFLSHNYDTRTVFVSSTWECVIAAWVSGLVRQTAMSSRLTTRLWKMQIFHKKFEKNLSFQKTQKVCIFVVLKNMQNLWFCIIHCRVSVKNPRDFCEICDFALFLAQGSVKKLKHAKIFGTKKSVRIFAYPRHVYCTLKYVLRKTSASAPTFLYILQKWNIKNVVCWHGCLVSCVVLFRKICGFAL